MIDENFIIEKEKINNMNLLIVLNEPSITYFIIETEFITNHIEKLSKSCKDRGSLKWIAESNENYYSEITKNVKAQKCFVDGSDLFPRVYFFPRSFLEEFNMWILMREQLILRLLIPYEYSPQFNPEYFKIL